MSSCRIDSIRRQMIPAHGEAVGVLGERPKTFLKAPEKPNGSPKPRSGGWASHPPLVIPSPACHAAAQRPLELWRWYPVRQETETEGPPQKMYRSPLIPLP